VERDGYVRLQDLSEEYGVAPVTIHRDLGFLEAAGALERVHGGARSISGDHHIIQTDYANRRTHAIAEKNAIALRALEEIPDGSTLFLDSSTTVLALAKHLEKEPGRGLTVVTNSPAIAFQLMAPLIHVILLPGEVNQSLRAVTGRWTVEFIEDLSFSVAFVSGAGITPEKGIMTTQRELGEVTKAVFARAERRIALIDSSKFGVSALVAMAPKDQIDLVITDDGLEAGMLDAYRAGGIDVVRAGE
jgi:DeoR family fructose operon transcriptional repressor